MVNTTPEARAFPYKKTMHDLLASRLRPPFARLPVALVLHLVASSGCATLPQAEEGLIVRVDPSAPGSDHGLRDALVTHLDREARDAGASVRKVVAGPERGEAGGPEVQLTLTSLSTHHFGVGRFVGAGYRAGDQDGYAFAVLPSLAIPAALAAGLVTALLGPIAVPLAAGFAWLMLRDDGGPWARAAAALTLCAGPIVLPIAAFVFVLVAVNAAETGTLLSMTARQMVGTTVRESRRARPAPVDDDERPLSPARSASP